MLDLNKLQIFAQVASAGSFSAAAEQLYLSQPAVSQHIHDLEMALGRPLFQRGRRGVTLTAEGKVLHEYTERILKLVAEAEGAVVDVAGLASGSIAVGATPGVSTYLLPHWTHLFGERFPKISVTLHTAITPDIVQMLLANQIDIGFVEGEIEPKAATQLALEALCDVPQLLVVGPKHAWWQWPSAHWADIDGQPFITRQRGSQSRIWLESVLREHRIAPRVVAEFDNPEAIKRSVMAGASMAMLPEYAVLAEVRRGALHVLPLEDTPMRMLRAAWNKSAPLSPIARTFLGHIDACIREA